MDNKNPVSFRYDLDTTADLPAIDAVELVEISGRVKWFDAVKGYGFVVPDNGAPDVLLHIATLRKDGFKSADEGTRIVCEAVRRAKGLQVFKIVSLDGSDAVHPSEWRPSRTRVEVVPTSGFQIAIVKWFNRSRGFGFLTQGEGTEDIFVHMETLRRYGIRNCGPERACLSASAMVRKGLWLRKSGRSMLSYPCRTDVVPDEWRCCQPREHRPMYGGHAGYSLKGPKCLGRLRGLEF